MSSRDPRAVVVAVLCGLVLVLAGCAVDPRVRVEGGPGESTPSAAPVQTAVAVPSDVDGLRVLKDDPGMDAAAVAAIEKCEGERYPVHADEISLHGDWGSVELMAVTIYTCPGRTCGYEGTRGTYVYRLSGDRPSSGRPGERVYAHEEAGSRVEVRDEALVLIRPEYRSGDAASCPTATRSTPLRWDGGALVLDGS